MIIVISEMSACFHKALQILRHTTWMWLSKLFSPNWHIRSALPTRPLSQLGLISIQLLLLHDSTL